MLYKKGNLNKVKLIGENLEDACFALYSMKIYMECLTDNIILKK